MKQFLTFLITGLLGISLAVSVIYFGYSQGWLFAVSLLLAGSGWLVAVWFYKQMHAMAVENKVSRTALSSALDETNEKLKGVELQRLEDYRRMQILVGLNHSLAQTGIASAEGSFDEQNYMESALSALTELVGGLGCSFVPVDEWQQPLPPFTHGRLPEPVLRAWASHLADGMLRDRCGSCHVLKSTPGGCPLHPEQVGNTLQVYCLPLCPGGGSIAQVQQSSDKPGENRVLGILHLYMPAGKAIDSGTLSFLEVLMHEIALGYESIHLRAQEQSTLRQIRLLNAPENDLVVSLGSLLDGLQQALDADIILLKLRSSSDERLSNLVIQRGELAEVSAILPDLFELVIRGETAGSETGTLPVWLAIPLALPEGQVLGMLFVAVNHPPDFHPRQKTILQTVAAQSALLIENERLIRSLEYKVVIQERTRLAREIHDGLAQTLAYLKLQSAQMQTYLAQGDLARLSNILKDNYQALADAYLDTRQAIDDLRLTPQDGITGWVQRAVQEFNAATGIEVELVLDPNAVERSLSIPLEIQAQLIRIVQETLSNVRKHARAQHVKIDLHEWRSDLVIEIQDNGIGFEAEDVPEVSRHGLRGMRERAELIGAEFQVISQRRNGTTVRLILPVGLEEGSSS